MSRRKGRSAGCCLEFETADGHRESSWMMGLRFESRAGRQQRVAGRAILQNAKSNEARGRARKARPPVAVLPVKLFPAPYAQAVHCDCWGKDGMIRKLSMRIGWSAPHHRKSNVFLAGFCRDESNSQTRHLRHNHETGAPMAS